MFSAACIPRKLARLSRALVLLAWPHASFQHKINCFLLCGGKNRTASIEHIYKPLLRAQETVL